MSVDSDAFKTVQQLPGLTPAEQQYLLTVSRGEGFYGLGWGNPNPLTVSLSERFGIDPKAGEGSNNWGAEQGQGSAGSFPHVDTHADGSPYVEQYKKHRTPAEGAASVARILLKPNVRAALALGDLRGAVFAQKANRYFELDTEKYLSAVKRNYGILTQRLGWPVLLSDPPPFVGTIATTPLAGSQSSESQPPSSGEHLISSRPTLWLGSSGKYVRAVQKALDITIDGKFGPLTRSAVKLFQSKQRIKADGIVGPITWRKLDEQA